MPSRQVGTTSQKEQDQAQPSYSSHAQPEHPIYLALVSIQNAQSPLKFTFDQLHLNPKHIAGPRSLAVKMAQNILIFLPTSDAQQRI